MNFREVVDSTLIVCNNRNMGTNNYANKTTEQAHRVAVDSLAAPKAASQ